METYSLCHTSNRCKIQPRILEVQQYNPTYGYCSEEELHLKHLRCKQIDKVLDETRKTVNDDIMAGCMKRLGDAVEILTENDKKRLKMDEAKLPSMLPPSRFQYNGELIEPYDFSNFEGFNMGDLSFISEI